LATRLNRIYVNNLDVKGQKMTDEQKTKVVELKAKAYDTMVKQASMIKAHNELMAAMDKERQDIAQELAQIEAQVKSKKE
jgi:hypothetical protein